MSPGHQSGRGGRAGGPKGRKSERGGPRGPIVRRGTVRLQHEVARRIRGGHPWIYKEALDRKRVMRERPGDPIEIVDWDGEFVARGVFDGDTAIAIRVIGRDPGESVGPELISSRVASALSLRRKLLDWDAQQCIRLVNSENDGLPATTVDRYGDFLIVQLYSSSMEPYFEPLCDALVEQVSPAGIYVQRRFKPLAGNAPPSGAELVRGVAAPVELEVREGELKFHVDVTAPLSPGLFPDLREGRRAIAEWSKGRRTLNLFSFTGAISVYAAHGGASEVVAVDVAAKAHARARRNFTLNNFDAEKPEHIAGDAFKVLAKFKERGRTFDLVAIDPPAFASGSRGGKPWSAVKDYGELVAASLDVLEPGGLLAAACSTHKMNLADFEAALSSGAQRAGTRLRIIDRRSLPVDFPRAPGFPEANYLKFAVAFRD